MTPANTVTMRNGKGYVTTRCRGCRDVSNAAGRQASKARETARRVLADIFEPIRPRGNWQPYSACRDWPAEMFFPEDGKLAGVPEAKAVCAGCPVRQECLADGLSYPDTRGIRGGVLLPVEILDIPTIFPTFAQPEELDQWPPST